MSINKYAGLITNDFANGTGTCVSFWTQGCPHRCTGCHNPETWDFDGGKEIDTEELLDEIKKDPLLDGVTLSGGDPLFQADRLIEFAKQIKEYGLNIWIYTGFIFDNFIKYRNNEITDDRINMDMIKLLEIADVVVDGPFIISKRTLNLKFRGSSNQRIIDTKKSFENNKIIEWR